MSLQLAYLSQSKVPSREANSVQVVLMCQAFHQEGASVRLHARPGEDDIPTDSIEDFYGIDAGFDISFSVHPEIRKVGGFIYAGRVLKAIRNGPRPDVLYGRHVISLLSSQRLGIPSFYEVHEPPGPRVKAMLERRLFKSSHFRGLIAITHSLADWYRSHVPELHDQTIVVEPDAARLPVETTAASLTGGDADRLQVGYVGRMYPGKGIEIVIPLAQRLPEFDFHVVGGDEGDVRDVVGETQLPSNLTIHGSVPHGNVGDLMNDFDVVLAPYQSRVAGRYGGNLAEWMSPLKVFEYLAHGRALIASDLPVLREVLTNRVTALLCEAADLDHWANALRELAADEHLRRNLGDAGRSLVRERFTWEARARRLLNAMSSVAP